jgi:hypothetical protein
MAEVIWVKKIYNKRKREKVRVMDKGKRVCVDPGGNGATMNAGGEGGPGTPGRGEDKQLVPNSGDG